MSHWVCSGNVEELKGKKTQRRGAKDGLVGGVSHWGERIGEKRKKDSWSGGGGRGVDKKKFLQGKGLARVVKRGAAWARGIIQH